ncbi:MAG: PQQ-binding-like beta-propeller repeat protein [Bacteroidales bacterium]|nr:PQQ-binding-like beta-propeller repeat protein [Bacteroidales bacterium]
MKNFINKFSITTLIIVIFLPFSIRAYTGEVIKSFKTPGSFPTGLTFDGKHLWLADKKTDKLYCINPKNGNIIRDIQAPAYWPMGLTWDGEALWNADVKGGIPLSENYDGKIYRINPENGTILRTIKSPSSTPRGLTWDGKYLWCVDNDSDEIIQFSPDDGTTIKSFKSPARDPRGLTFDGKYLWVSDRSYDEIYMVDPETGNVLIVCEAPGPFTRGLTYDGENLWAVDYQNDKIYQLKIRDGEKYKRSKEKKSKVTFYHQITNFGPGDVITADVYFAIPSDRPNQTITGIIDFSPEPANFLMDKWGQETAHFSYQNIKQGEIKNSEMKLTVNTYDVRYFIYPEEVGSMNEIPSEIKTKYLENNEKYQYDHYVIQNAVKEAVGDEKNPYWIARNIYNYLIKNMYYEMQGGWNTAPTVLARGNGSCSEYAFICIAMCRAAGLPARYVGSVVIRGDDACMDDVFHRWVEIYLPGYGWIPVDPSGGDSSSPRNQANYFGHLSNRYLITTESGGGSETMSWTYNSNEFWTTDPKTNIIVDHFAEWEPIQ